MPRKGSVPKREILPDPKYHDKLVARFINGVMTRGKKSIAESIIYGCLDIIEDKMKKDPVEVMKKALDNVKPHVEVKSRRIGGATYQVPTEVRYERQLSLAIRWLTMYSRSRSEHTMRERLAMEILDAYSGRGSSFKKREDVHRMAEANKAFAHYRW